MTEEKINFLQAVKAIARVRFEKGQALNKEKVKRIAVKYSQKDVKYLCWIGQEINKEITAILEEENGSLDLKDEEKQREVIERALKKLAKKQMSN